MADDEAPLRGTTWFCDDGSARYEVDGGPRQERDAPVLFFVSVFVPRNDRTIYLVKVAPDRYVRMLGIPSAIDSGR